MLFRTYLVIVLRNKGVPAQAPVLSFCRLETTALTMYFAPITGALAGLPSNLRVQGPAAGSWPQLGIQGPGAGSWPHLAIQGPGAPYLPLEIRREGQLRRRDPSTDTEALEHRLRRKRRERPATQKSPVADDATRPVPSGGTEQSKGRSGRRAHLREEDPGSPRRGSDQGAGHRHAARRRRAGSRDESRGDPTRHRGRDHSGGSPHDDRRHRAKVGDRDDSRLPARHRQLSSQRNHFGQQGRATSATYATARSQPSKLQE